MFAGQLWTVISFYRLIIVLLVALISCCCGFIAMREAKRDCRASWKYELTKGRGLPPSTSLYPSASGKAWVKSFFFLSLRVFSHQFLSAVRYFSISPFLHLSFCPLTQQLNSPYTSANRNFHSRPTARPSHSNKWEHAARMHTLKEVLWIFKC